MQRQFGQHQIEGCGKVAQGVDERAVEVDDGCVDGVAVQGHGNTRRFGCPAGARLSIVLAIFIERSTLRMLGGNYCGFQHARLATSCGWSETDSASIDNDNNHERPTEASFFQLPH